MRDIVQSRPDPLVHTSDLDKACGQTPDRAGPAHPGQHGLRPLVIGSQVEAGPTWDVLIRQVLGAPARQQPSADSRLLAHNEPSRPGG